MIIDKEVLAEKNYTGTRLIEINDPTVKKFQAEVALFAPQAEPWLKKLEDVTRVLDPARIKIREINEKAKKEIEAVKTECNFDAVQKEESDYIAELENIDQKATLIKNKMTPVVNDLLKDQLGEFEIARHLTVKEDKIFAEVFDEIEEKVKAIRAQKAKQVDQTKTPAKK